jgi:hypothetical protein
MKMIKIKTFLGILLVLMILMVSTVYAGHFEESSTSPILMHLAGYMTIDGEEAMPGDEVGIFDTNGKIIGSFVVENSGMFGDIAVTGDDDLSVEKEGALEGEPLDVRVWQKSTGSEYSAGNISISGPAEDKAIYASYPGDQLRFDGGMFYLLNIEVVK